MDHIDIRVGKNLRHYRKLAGLTQQQLGDMLGTTQQQVAKYETGQNAIVASRIYRIAEVLDIPIGALFADEDEESDEDEDEEDDEVGQQNAEQEWQPYQEPIQPPRAPQPPPKKFVPGSVPVPLKPQGKPQVPDMNSLKPAQMVKKTIGVQDIRKRIITNK